MPRFLSPVTGVLLLFTGVAAADDLTLAQQAQLIQQVREEIQQRYAVTDQVADIDRMLGDLADDPSSGGVRAPADFAEHLTQALRRFDLHFGVHWRHPEERERPRAGESWFARLDWNNSGFKRVEILDGNIGYVDFWGFDDVNDRSAARVAAVMTLIAGADAIIFDLRSNGGGSGEMVRLISSYLLDGGIHLNSFYWRATDTTTESWTTDDIPGAKRTDVPVYVLTSKDTFSAAEEFAYNLKQLQRATLIGEATRGGANPWQFFELQNGFSMAIPIARAINPVTGGNWEGVGVQPDVRVSHDAAFIAAYRLALTRAGETAREPQRREEIEEALAALKQAEMGN